MRHHALGLDVVLGRGPQIGVPQKIGGDADVVWSRVDQLGHGDVTEQVRPNMLAKGLLGAGSICCRIAALRIGRP
jgi:hypothetical protein